MEPKSINPEKKRREFEIKRKMNTFHNNERCSQKISNFNNFLKNINKLQTPNNQYITV
jgi:hypothetical protein